MQEIEVSIRPLKLKDAEAVQRYASDPRVADTTTIPHPYPQDGGLTFVENSLEAQEKRESFQFAIIVDNEMIGVIGLNRADFENYTVNVDYAIASSHWGKGIMTTVVSLTLKYAFEELQMKEVNSACLKRNPGSRRVLEKNGFSNTGEFIYTSSKFKGEPAFSFSLTRNAWEELRSYQTD